MAPWMLALLGPKLRQITRTFTSNETWVVPFGVPVLATVSGYGAAGQSYTIQSASVTVASVSSTNSAGANTSSYTWNDLNAILTSTVANLNTGGSGKAYDSVSVTVYNNGNQSASAGIFAVGYEVVGASAIADTSPGWSSSGSISYGSDAFARVGFSYYDYTPTTGASATAFGRTFPGGTGGPASPTNFTNVAVTEGASYPVVVPAGGSVTITYYQ